MGIVSTTPAMPVKELQEAVSDDLTIKVTLGNGQYSAVVHFSRAQNHGLRVPCFVDSAQARPVRRLETSNAHKRHHRILPYHEEQEDCECRALNFHLYCRDSSKLY